MLTMCPDQCNCSYDRCMAGILDSKTYGIELVTQGKKVKSIYIIGSMKNPEVQRLAVKLRSIGFEVFDDWISPGPETDDEWQKYEKYRGRTYKEALNGWHAKDVFEFDKRHLDAADIAILVSPAGKSAHIELGYMVGKEKKAYVLFDKEPERYDLMYLFATDVFFDEEELIRELQRQ